MSKLTNAQLATIELAFRAVPKADRKDESIPAVAARTKNVPTEIRSLGGADLRTMAGAAAAGIVTQVEAKVASLAEKRAAAQAEKAQAVTRKATSERTATAHRTSERDFFAHVEAAGRAAGYSIPRWITAGAKGRDIGRKA